MYAPPGTPRRTYPGGSGHYLTYVDASADEPRMCWKKLIRYVAFPPDYELLKVDWFN